MPTIGLILCSIYESKLNGLEFLMTMELGIVYIIGRVLLLV